MDILQVIAYVIMPLFTVFGGYFMRSLIVRIESLESKIQDKLSDTAVRLVIDDKIDPISDDIRDIKNSIQKLFDLYLSLRDSKHV